MSIGFLEYEHPTIEFLGIAHEKAPSDISGGQSIRWLGKPVTLRIPLIKRHAPDILVKAPKGYWVPPTWPEIIEKLELHGVRFERLASPREVEVEMYRIHDAKLDNTPYEGRVRVSGKAVPEKRTQLFPVGSVWVSTDQPLGELAVILLEPDSPDSFFQWGYFHEILQRTEYFESYAAEPLARRMLEENPQLEREFKKKVETDPEFAKNPRARLYWFYQRSPYFDERWLLYPIARAL